MKEPLRQLKRAIRKPAKQLQYRRLIRRSVEKQLRNAGVGLVPWRLEASAEPLGPTDLILRKERGNIVALTNLNRPTGAMQLFCERIATHLYWFANTADNIKEIAVDISDGNAPTHARYRFSTTSSHYVPVPDPFFFESRGYAWIDALNAQDATPWDDRGDDIIWRGDLNGDGLFSLDPAVAQNPALIPRLGMALACRNLDVDFRFVMKENRPSWRVLQAAGLMADYIQPAQWGHQKYAIDIDGYTCAWNNFMQRLKLGCCILKVDSKAGNYQWYYHKLTPWEHFVPIRSDLSDLEANIAWVKTHPSKARDIAAAGQSVANKLTFESERQAAVDAIEMHEG